MPSLSRPGARLVIPAWLKKLPDLLPGAAARALQSTREVLLERARENVGERGPRFLTVRSGRLLRSLRTEVRVQGNTPTLTLRAARHGWVWEHSGNPNRQWASDAAQYAMKQYPKFLRQEVRRQQGKGGSA